MPRLRGAIVSWRVETASAAGVPKCGVPCRHQAGQTSLPPRQPTCGRLVGDCVGRRCCYGRRRGLIRCHPRYDAAPGGCMRACQAGGCAGAVLGTVRQAVAAPAPPPRQAADARTVAAIMPFSLHKSGGLRQSTRAGSGATDLQLCARSVRRPPRSCSQSHATAPRLWQT